MIAKASGDGLRAVPFRFVNCVDFEYRSGRGNRPDVVCMVVREARGGETRRYWKDELYDMARAPFETGPDAVMVAYAAQAELACFLALGWPRPDNVVDQYAEFRAQTNGIRRNASLLDAMSLYSLPHMDAAVKEDNRDLVLSGSESDEDKVRILDYCESDVDAGAALLLATADSIDWPRALYRGEYSAAVAAIEYDGIPINLGLLRSVRKRWPRIRRDLIADVDGHYGIYDGETFKLDRFSRWLRHNRIPWPRLESGLLDTSDEAFKLQETAWPIIAPLRELRNTVRQGDLNGLQVGVDARARTSLRPYGSVTGRNQPSTAKFPFGTAKWMRGFIAPSPERDLAYVDFYAQEMAIAAGLSGDPALIAAYLDGDVYIAFAKQAKLVPSDATKYSHPAIRNACKVVVLGLNYGMGAESMALQAGITVAQARELIALHKRTYRVFWKWSDDMVNVALLARKQRTVFGWPRRLIGGEKSTSIRNFPMQANGAEMMRVAAIGAMRVGIEVCAPVHDAFLIAAPASHLAEEVEAMRQIMTEAGRVVCGLPVRTEAKLIQFPDRYMEERGIDMWNRVMRLGNMPQAHFDGSATV